MWRKCVLPVLILYHLARLGVCQKIDATELKCLVCEKTIEEIQSALAKLDPSIQVDAGGYRLDGEGNLRKKTISQTTSEVFLSDMLDEVCKKMDDYVRARWKTSGELTLMKLLGDDGKMAFEFDQVDIVQDADLNKSLKYYCEMLIEEHEDEIVKNLASGADHVDVRVCSLTTNYCNRRLPQEEL